MMKFLGIIPARYQSTRFPGKVLAKIRGKSMIEHVYERAAQVCEHTVVATDDAKIVAAVEAFGGEVVMTSAAHRSGTDRCAEAVLNYEEKTGSSFDTVINIQGDEPFILAEHLTVVMDSFEDEKTEISTLVKIIDKPAQVFNPDVPKVVTDNRSFALYFSRSPIPYLRDIPENQWHAEFDYYKHLGIYAYKKDILQQLTRLQPTPLELTESLEQNRWLENGYKIKVCLTDKESYSVDTPEDLAYILENYDRITNPA